MTNRITIRLVGNRSLYRDLYTAIDSETSHHTASGAARRMVALHSEIERLASNFGNFGHVEIEINGQRVPSFDADGLFFDTHLANEGKAGARNSLETAWEKALTALPVSA